MTQDSKTQKRRTVSKKTVIGSVVIPLWVFAVEQASAGDVSTAGGAAVIATALFAAYEWIGIRDVPLSGEDLRELSEDTGDSLADVIDSIESDGSRESADER